MLGISGMNCNGIKKNISEEHIGLVKTGNFLAFDLILAYNFKA